jgi:hypothetical protein
LQLHGTWRREAAIQGFQGGDRPLDLCGGQFCSLPGVVLCFFTLGKGGKASHLSSPSVVVWRPERSDSGAAGGRDWLPAPARDTRRWGTEERRKHHLFLRDSAGQDYVYAGAAHLGSYGGPPSDPTAVFYLETRLPRQLWLQLGGYGGWQVEVNHQTHEVPLDDVEGFRRLVVMLSEQEFSHLIMTRYEEDSLHLHANSRRGWLMYLRQPDDSGLYLRTGFAGMGAQEPFRCGCGIALEVPLGQTVAIDDAKVIVEQFFREGHLPAGHEWVEES